MKKLVFGFVVTVMFALSGNAQTNAVGEILTYSKVNPKIVISGKLHKQNPRKDGTDCSCIACFGLCDLNIVVTVERQSNLTVGSHDLVFHVVEDIKHAEDIMYIDEDLTRSYNNQKIVIKKGEYKYVKERKEIDVNGKKMTSYGYSILKIEVI
ncbi:hypothetical protein FEDK69T_10210 [Flavobacterium enshiense DK69]|uniref:Uncharacterized protein n=1 Tax=Flavobacterium enshiense DK69 TaxID=1107311 RepID=V6SBA1_9FLAO|nr:hypothetical protein [Flavobacterium enshiense]ESU23963.1 hypothetical protein FEDK69T_10210 [Flavobacterium enshiense DK69]KGO96246.1 hypothetical protein Q767_08320 [Flavobacterium enshiense DK69]